MQTTYGGRPTGPSAGMVFCTQELMRINSEPLRSGCEYINGAYKCIVQFKAKRYPFNSHETITACNAQHDKELARLQGGAIPKKSTRKPLAKGYRTLKNRDGSITFYPFIMLGGKKIGLGSTRCEEKAQGIYMLRFEKEFGQ